jgi:hypothetical protein
MYMAVDVPNLEHFNAVVNIFRQSPEAYKAKEQREYVRPSPPVNTGKGHDPSLNSWRREASEMVQEIR